MFGKKTLTGLKVTMAAAVFAAGMSILAPQAKADICIAPRLDGNEIVHVQEFANKNGTIFYLSYPDGSPVRNTKTGTIYTSFKNERPYCGLPKDEIEKTLKAQGVEAELKVIEVTPKK